MNTKADEQTEKRTIMAFMVFSVTVLLGFAHLMSWGSYAFSIPFLKAAQITGTASASTLEEIIKACVSNDKYSCAEQAHLDLYQVTKDPEVISRLANLQSKVAKEAAALVSYKTYVQIGGKNSEGLLRYAQLLEKTGNAEEAINQYQAAAKAQTDRLPVRAMTGLVRLLMSQRRYQDAYDQIAAFYQSAENADGYFVAEMESLSKVVKTSKKMAAR